MTPRSWRMVHTIAQRMGMPFDHRQHTVRLLEEGRQVAGDVRKAIVSKRPPAARPSPHSTSARSTEVSRSSGTVASGSGSAIG